MRYCLVITIFNNADETADLINSLKIKSITFDCILIIDDCSTDDVNFLGARQFKEKFENIEFLKLPTNFGGPGKSRNLGLKFAIENRYDVVTFIDPDDRLNSGFFLELERLQNKYKDAQIFSFSPHKLQDHTTKSKKDRLLTLNDFKYFNPLTFSGLTIKLKSFNYTGFSDDKSHIAVEDYKFYMDVIINGNILVQSGLPFIHYGASGEHLSKNKWKMLKKFTFVNIEKFGLCGIPFRLLIYIMRGFVKHRMLFH